MDDPSRLELAILNVIALQTDERTAELRRQIEAARVTERENTGAGYFTTFDVGNAPPIMGLGPPVGWTMASVEGLTHGMGFVLWVRDGAIHQLEGYANADEDTSGLNFARVAFGDVETREP